MSQATPEAFQAAQYRFAAHLRNPDKNPAPPGVEPRRLGIYRELIYNNIQGFISGAFPVLRQIVPDDHWQAMVADFVERHQSHSPYFLEISQEFLRYLQEERGAVEGDPAFMLELAHYEWVELALDVAEESLPDNCGSGKSLLESHPQVSPLAWCLSYQFPVHRLGPDYQPAEPPTEPSFLVVYRNREDKVEFMEANAVTVRLLQLLEADDSLSGRAALLQVAEELQHPDPQSLVASGGALLEKLYALDIICSIG